MDCFYRTVVGVVASVCKCADLGKIERNWIKAIPLSVLLLPVHIPNVFFPGISMNRIVSMQLNFMTLSDCSFAAGEGIGVIRGVGKGI